MQLYALIIAFSISFSLLASESQENSHPILPRLIVAANGFVPPYVIQQDDSGIQLEIIKAALQIQGYKDLKFVYMSNKRAEHAITARMVDVVVNLPVSYEGRLFSSEPLLDYQNIAVTLKANGYQIQSIQDLRGYGVVAFQNAQTFLGQEYRLAANYFRSYEEVINQEAQVELLMKGWADVIVLERRIFEFYLAQYAKHDLPKEVSVHPIFSSSPRPIYFVSETTRDAFNRGLKQIKETGQYQAIFATVGNQYAQRELN
ncbi:ABC-type amino acid transport/signal transduction systems, periplasmic component/domain [Pseudoalteromonas luteoviolacea B = ATCC 29581]|nr:ABC-type amino acid transport/signal transduction systems, periplasmic component/domain [Pseudoalteromonas luteoviolacea B = ATCC 29581]